MTGFPSFFCLASAASFNCRSRIQVEASTRGPHVPLVRFHVAPSSRKGLKVLCEAKGKMLQPADEAPPPAPVPLPTENDEAAAREAHPEAAAALQRAEDALAWAKQTDDDEQIALARLAFCGTHPQGLNWRPWLNSFLVPKKKTTTARPHNCCGRSATRSCGRCSRRRSSWSVAPRLALSSKNDDESSTYSCSRRRNPRGSRPHLYCGTRPAPYDRSANLSWGHSVRRNARKLPVSRR